MGRPRRAALRLRAARRAWCDLTGPRPPPSDPAGSGSAAAAARLAATAGPAGTWRQARSGRRGRGRAGTPGPAAGRSRLQLQEAAGPLPAVAEAQRGPRVPPTPGGLLTARARGSGGATPHRERRPRAPGPGGCRALRASCGAAAGSGLPQAPAGREGLSLPPPRGERARPLAAALAAGGWPRARPAPPCPLIRALQEPAPLPGRALPSCQHGTCRGVRERLSWKGPAGSSESKEQRELLFALRSSPCKGWATSAQGQQGWEHGAPQLPDCPVSLQVL